MPRVYDTVGINFGTEDEFDFQLIYAINRVKAITNSYIGNKRKILFKILKTIYELPETNLRVLDLFSGSACLSIAMNLLNWRVMTNDLLLSSWIYAEAYVRLNTTLTDEQKKFLLTHHNAHSDHFVQHNFGERFSKEECVFLDNYYANVVEMCSAREYASKGDIAWMRRCPSSVMAFAALQLFVLDKCFVGGRLNNGQVLAAREHRIEHKRNSGAEMIFKKMPWPDLKPKKILSSKTFNLDAIEILQIKPCWLDGLRPNVVYIDPPYGGQQSDYGHMFSFFESYLVRHMPDKWTHIRSRELSRFSSVKDYENHFSQLLDAADAIPTWVISYNDSSWADIDKVKSMISDTGRHVEVTSLDYEYKYRDIKNKAGTEYLIVAK